MKGLKTYWYQWSKKKTKKNIANCFSVPPSLLATADEVIE